MSDGFRHVLESLNDLALEAERHVSVPVAAVVASLVIHALIVPALFLLSLMQPDLEKNEVFLLEGGLVPAGGSGETRSDEEDEDWEAVLAEQDDDSGADRDEWDRDAVDTSDRDRFDAWGIPKPGAFDDREEDEDWDDAWFEKSKGSSKSKSGNPLTVIIDDDLDEEDEDDDWLDEEEDEEDDEDLDVSGYNIEIDEDDEDEEDLSEDVAEQIEKLSGDHESWDQLFSGKGGQGGGQKGLKLPPAGDGGKVSSLDGTIRSMIESSPYGGGKIAGALNGSSAGTTLGEPADQFDELLAWIPPDCLMASLISLSSLRSRSDREEIERTLRSIGIFKKISGGVEFSLLDSVDSVLIASVDPMDERETFVVMRHSLPEEEIRDIISAQLKASGGVTIQPGGLPGSEWWEMYGDEAHAPWIYFTPSRGYVVIMHLVHRDSVHQQSWAGTSYPALLGSERTIGELERHLRMGLVQPELMSAPADLPGVEDRLEEPPAPVSVVLGSVMFGDAFKSLVDGTAFPVPGEVLLTGRFAADGEVHMEGSAMFPMDGQPEGFLSEWKKHVAPLQANDLIELVGASGLIGIPIWTQDGPRRLLLDAEVQASDVPKLMALVRLLVAAPEDRLPPPGPEAAAVEDDELKKPSKPGSKGSSPAKGAKKPSSAVKSSE